MHISASNQLKGTVEALTKGTLNTEVLVALDGGGQLAALITQHSVERLGLTEGQRVLALVKASSPLLMVGDAKVSARNALSGVVAEVDKGCLNSSVTLHVNGKPFVVQITKASVDHLGLAVGQTATVLIKASQVLIATE